MTAEEIKHRERIRGISALQLEVYDHLTPHDGISFYNESGRTLARRGVTALLPGSAIPRSMRVVWREGDFKLGGGDWEGGTIVGESSAEAASRIPDAVFDSVRREGGQFRLKAALIGDDLYVGWDILRRKPDGSRRYFSTGGDYKERRLLEEYTPKNIWEPGWYIDKKTGDKVDLVAVKSYSDRSGKYESGERPAPKALAAIAAGEVQAVDALVKVRTYDEQLGRERDALWPEPFAREMIKEGKAKEIK